MRVQGQGRDQRFARLVESHRGELRNHCRRMLRSPEDAEDALQETLIRAWRGLPGFEGRGSVRSWLYRIATNEALDTIRRRRKGIVPIDGGESQVGMIDSLVDERRSTEDRYEDREAAEFALEAVTRLLSARQRSVLVLRDVLGFSAAETADRLDPTVAAVNSALQRARATIDRRRPQPSMSPLPR